LVKNSSPAVLIRYVVPQSTAFGGPCQPNIGPVYSSTVKPELLPDELDCVHSSRMFLLITNAAMLVIITGSSALISLLCLNLFVTFAEIPNILLTANRALFSRPLLFSFFNCAGATCSVVHWLWLWYISDDFPFNSTVVTSLALRPVGSTQFDGVLTS